MITEAYDTNEEALIREEVYNSFEYSGSLISGTMKSEDLIPSFYELLRQISREKAEEVATWYSNTFELEEGFLILTPERVRIMEDEASWLLENLFDALDSLADDGFYFGAHPGDGADFGYWLYEDEF